jgi:arabinoxylan arabinofuranohydrolase
MILQPAAARNRMADSFNGSNTRVTKSCVKIMAIIFMCSFFSAPSADNCFITNHPTSDPAPSVFTYNGVEKVYFYCTQDKIGTGNGDYPIDTVHCYSTADMYHWKDEGVSLYEKAVSWAASNVDKLWAPHIVYLKGSYRLTVPETATDGKFYNFMATCNNPVGPYSAGPQLPGSVSNVIDPFIFIDPSDSAVWLSYRHQDGKNLGFVQMNDSATRITGNINNSVVNVGAGAPSGYKEGSWMWKYKNHYFLVFAGVPGSGNEIIGYSTSRDRAGPWTYRGQIFAQNNSPSEFTIHSGACQFRGQWYIFYHNVNFGGSIFGSERCSGIEYLTYSNDSTINTAAISKTNRGVGVPSAYNDSIQVDRGVITGASSVAIPYNASGAEKTGWYIGSITNNATVRYDSVNFTPTTGNKIGAVVARVSSTNAAGAIEVRIGSSTGALLGAIAVPSTGNLNTWTTTAATTLTADPPIGNQNLVLVFKTSATNALQVNWIQFSQAPVTSIRVDNVFIDKSGFNCRRINKNLFEVYCLKNAASAQVKVYTMTGRELTQAALVKNSGWNRFTANLDKKALTSGTYILSFRNQNLIHRIRFAY